MKHYAITITLIALVACNEQPITTNYMCDNTAAQLDIISNKQATLRFNKHDYLLTHEVSASGSKYINNKVLFWSKGEQAMLIINGKKYQCTSN
ncbi:MliC family protein [Pseudoalteromonas sp. 2CM36K]|nr:MliC family protein [Pseudoalteromonas sp. 2CM36K]MCK8104471.1 MliC family protein [Pseudoalteromonas sp. 2CM36K]